MVGPNRSAASRAHPTSAAIAADPESAATTAARRGHRRPLPLSPVGLRSATGFTASGSALSDPARPNALDAQPNTDAAATRFAPAANPVEAASPHSGTSQRAAATEPTSAPSVFAA